MSSSLCLRCNYALSLIHPAPQVTSGQGSRSKTSRPAHTMDLHSQGGTGRTERRGRRTFSQTSASLSLHLSIISPHVSEESGPQRLCPHPPAIARAPTPLHPTPHSTPHLKQTCSARIPPLLFKTRLCSVCEERLKQSWLAKSKKAC